MDDLANHALQRTRHVAVVGDHFVPRADGTTVSLHLFEDAGSLSLGR